MSSHNDDDHLGSRFDVWINWEGIARMLGWKGSIEEMRKLRVPRRDLGDDPKSDR